MSNIEPFRIGDIIPIGHKGGAQGQVKLIGIPLGATLSDMPKCVDVRWGGECTSGIYGIDLKTGSLIHKRKPLLWSLSPEDLIRLQFTIKQKVKKDKEAKKPKFKGTKFDFWKQ